MMRVQDHLIRQTQRALDDVLRAAAAVPEDRLDWQPEPSARSVMSQLTEIAAYPAFFIALAKNGSAPDMSQHGHEPPPSNLADIRESMKQGTSELCRVISSLSDAELEREVTLPFGGGMAMTLVDALTLHAWNMTYHLGQINYIQTMLGDRDMH